ncbi:MAG: hypothetical protein KAW89_01705, partial [Armatimonadetes bacterium]|nr:hypothetical protein [Armatimonadota bacterium]
RGWGWWCGIVFTGVWIVGGLGPLIVMMSAALFPSHGLVPAPRSFLIGFLSTYLVVASLLLWVLTTRRRLFFPPKQEGVQ